MKKIPLYACMLVLIVLIVPAISIKITQFSNGLAEENLTFTGNQSIVRYLDLPISTRIFNASLYLQGISEPTNSSAYNESLLAYYKFERNTSDEGNFSLTLTNTSALQYGVGKIGTNSLNLSGDLIRNLSYISVDLNVRTLDFWINPIESAGSRLITYQNVPISDYGLFQFYANGSLFTDLFGGTTRLEGPTPISINKWTHIIVTTGLTGAKLYINGSLQDSDPQTSIFGSLGATAELYVGSETAGGNQYNGSIDNLYISAMQYTDEDASNSYNEGDGIDFSTGIINQFPLNPWLEVGDIDNNREWNYTGSYQDNESISIDPSYFNTLLDNGCNCSSCIYEAQTCQVPFTFHSDSTGILRYFNIGVTTLLEIILIDEVDNTIFNLNETVSARVYWDENRSFYDFKATNQTNFNNTNITDDKMRFEFRYSDGTIITRWIDASLIDATNLRVCVNKEGVTHYEQLIISASQKRTVLKNLFSDCIIAADYTRFAYQDAFLLKAYTIDSLYFLYTYDEGQQIYLASVDGSVASFINIDTLEFQREGYDINILSDALTFQKTDNTTIQIYYNNLKDDNTALALAITRMDTNTEVFTTSDFTDPNEFTLYFNYVTLGVNSSTLFLLELDKTTSAGATTIKRYFNTGASTGVISAGFALVISILATVFGMTFAAARITFSFFGIIIQLAAIFVCALSVAAWFITFLQVINVIILVFIIIIMVTKNTATVS